MSGDGSELAPNYHMIPQSYGGSLPDYPEILPPGLTPCNHNSQGYTNHSAPAPYVSSQLTSLAAPAHLNSIYTAGVHPAPQMLVHPDPHFIHTNQPSSLTQITRQPQSIKQETGGLPCFLEQDPGLIPSQGPPFIKQQPPFIKEEPGLFAPSTFIKQEPDLQRGGHLPPGGNLPHGEHPFIKEEPGLPHDGHMFIKQEPGLVGGMTKQFSLEGSSSFLEKKPGIYCGNSAMNQEMGAPGEVFPAFPSQPLYLNFMADIEDIVQPSNGGEWLGGGGGG